MSKIINEKARITDPSNESTYAPPHIKIPAVPIPHSVGPPYVVRLEARGSSMYMTIWQAETWNVAEAFYDAVLAHLARLSLRHLAIISLEFVHQPQPNRTFVRP